MTAFGAVVIVPFTAYGTYSVRASFVFRMLCTAVLTEAAVFTDGSTAVTCTAFRAHICAVGAVRAAVYAKDLGAFTAVMTVGAHIFSAVRANAAVGTELVDTS